MSSWKKVDGVKKVKRKKWLQNTWETLPTSFWVLIDQLVDQLKSRRIFHRPIHSSGWKNFQFFSFDQNWYFMRPGFWSEQHFLFFHKVKEDNEQCSNNVHKGSVFWEKYTYTNLTLPCLWGELGYYYGIGTFFKKCVHNPIIGFFYLKHSCVSINWYIY